METNATSRRHRQFRLRAWRRKRQRLVNPGRTAVWRNNLINGELDESEWKDDLRMSREDFMVLVDKLRPYLSSDSESFRKDTIPIEKI